MATNKETVEFLLTKFRHADRIAAKPMFGEYGVYADGKMVALICDDRLYVKMVPASLELENLCEKGEPYPRAKLHYVLDEGQLAAIPQLPGILFRIAEEMPEKKRKKK